MNDPADSPKPVSFSVRLDEEDARLLHRLVGAVRTETGDAESVQSVLVRLINAECERRGLGSITTRAFAHGGKRRGK